MSAKRLLKAVLPDLGRGLVLVDNGLLDEGVKQDLFHAQH